MSLTEEKRERIKNYIMEKIFKDPNNFAKKASETFGISLTSVYKYTNELIKEGKIDKKGKGTVIVLALSNMDFSGVSEIGQGFAHELFNVFTKKHPEIDIQCINANDDIKKMINHVRKS